MTSANGKKRAVVFDCDGLLLDTERLWARGEEQFFARYGKPYGPEEKLELLGKNGEDLARSLSSLLDRPVEDGQDLVLEMMEISHREVAEGEANPMPGAAELVEALRGRVPIGVATNAPRGLAEISLRKAGLLEAFDVLVGVDEVSLPKPDPELYLAVCERLDADPARSVGFEDSPAGSEAARAAGLYVIGVPSHPGVRLDAADRVVESLEHPTVRAVLAQRLGFEEE
jgi:HAD superfamily hydrolase (TIGR01509 family)